MPASVSVGPAWAMDGPTYNGADLRPIFAGLLAAGPIQVMSGVLPGGGALFVTAGSGMTVVVGTGDLVIASSAGVTAGGYLGAVNTSTTLTITGSDPVNPRIDLVCATVSDVGNSSSAWLLQVITGTPSGSPVAPSLPANSLALATVLVPANSLSVAGGNVTDQRVFTAMQGGIIPVPNLTTGLAALTPYAGLYVHDEQTGRLVRVSLGGAAQQPQLLPFVPQLARRTTVVGAVSGSITVLSASVTTDGNTDIEILAKWYAVTIATSGALGTYSANLNLLIDGTQVASVLVPATTSGESGPGGSLPHVTSSGIDRPAAGTHTVVLQLQVVNGDGTHQLQVSAGATAPATLYVRPAPL